MMSNNKNITDLGPLLEYSYHKKQQYYEQNIVTVYTLLFYVNNLNP